MRDQIHIEPQNGKFATVFVTGNSRHEMDVRDTYKEAEKLAFYLAQRVKGDVYYNGQKVKLR